MQLCADNSASVATAQRTEEKPNVRRTLGQATHEVSVPLLAIRHIGPNYVPLADKSDLLLWSDSVQHLKFERIGGAVEPLGPVFSDRDQPGIVCGKHRIALARHEHVHAA